MQDAAIQIASEILDRWCRVCRWLIVFVFPYVHCILIASLMSYHRLTLYVVLVDRLTRDCHDSACLCEYVFHMFMHPTGRATIGGESNSELLVDLLSGKGIRADSRAGEW